MHALALQDVMPAALRRLGCSRFRLERSLLGCLVGRGACRRGKEHPMKKIEAVVRPFELDTLHAQLVRAGVEGMTVGEVMVPGHQLRCYRGVTYATDFEPKLRVELAVPDDQLASTLDVMTRTTDAGGPIATDILVLPVYDAVRIRTGEHLVWPKPDRAQGSAEAARAQRPAA
jgi:nitrogen regulatory protein P-II 1